ncbi:MAG: glycosyltransferase family 4 protein [Porphyromonadaceae bacterium]|nr:glycosyltransferase family 4 protein [Porphyromonadaceae bacterium]
MTYLITTVILIISELVYFRIAKHYNIVDKPNLRSSHSFETIRGGGIVYWVAAVLYFIFNFHSHSLWFLGGLTLIGFISLWDDISGLSQRIRFLFQLIAMTFIFYFTNVFDFFPWWFVVIGYFFFVGIVNAYNFMDGINGITGLYSIAVLLPLLYINIYVTPFVENEFIIYPLIASVVFLFFNFRKNARCFAGDVGNMSIAFWIVTLLLILIIKTNNKIWIGFLFVYGVDTALTIIHRIYLKQNIFEAHRLHFYQILANEKNVSHQTVSLFYFVAQLVCTGMIIVFCPIIGWWIVGIIFLILTSIYLLKFKWMKQKTNQ